MTSSELLLGLDVGGSGGHCLLLDAGGACVASVGARWSYPTDAVAPFAYRIDAELTWERLAGLVQRALAESGAEPRSVAGIAVTSMRHGTVLLEDGGAEEDGSVLFAAPNRDARGAQAASALAAERGEELHQRTGHWPAPLFPAARLLWLAEERPELLERSRVTLAVNEWVAHRMTGELATEPSQAGESLLFDLQTRQWAWDLIDSLGLPRRIFPPVREAGARLGQLLPAAARELGLEAGTPVAVGGADTQCGLLGLGVVEPGQIGVIAGSTAPVQMVVDQPRLDPEARLWTGHHLPAGRWVMESNAGAVGRALEWIARILHPRSSRPVERLTAEAALSDPGAGGLLSDFGVERFDARHLAFPMGSLALSPFLGNGASGHRGLLARAVIEGMAFGLHENVEQLIAQAGGAPTEIRLAGGLARSGVLSELVAELAPGEVRISEIPDASAVGAAMCAGVAAGLFGGLEEGARLAPLESRRAVNRERIRAHFESWRSWRAASRESTSAAAELALSTLGEPAGAERAWDSPAEPPRVLVTATLDEGSLSRLRRRAVVDDEDHRRDMTVLSGDELVARLSGRQVLVTEVDLVDAEALTQLPELRVIFCCRGNPVNVDIPAATALGIPVIRTPGRNADAVADLTVALVLNLFRRVIEADRFLRLEGEGGDKARLAVAYDTLRGHELGRKTIGCFGLGAVGERVVERLLPFGPRVLVHDPFVPPDEILRRGAEPAERDRLLAESDCITLHCALTQETRGLIGAEELARTRPGTLLVNTARAGLIDEDALTEALVSGHLGGAALDVFAEEPPPSDHPLLALPNVIATPHVAGNTHDVAAHQGGQVVEGLERLLDGERAPHVVNPEAFDGFDWNRPRRVRELDRARLASAPPAVCDWEPAAPERGADRPRPRVGNLFGLLGRREKSGAETSALSAAAGSSRPAMSAILARFVEAIGTDDALCVFAADKDITVHYRLTDLDLEFFTRFRKGVVSGALGAPDERPEVVLKMRASTLDRIFTDRLNGTKAALSGKLSFSGDTIKAIKLKRIQPDLNRIYRGVRGNEGELIEDEPATESPASTVPQAPPTPVRLAAGDVRHELVEVLDELYAAALVTSTGGNVSVRAAESGEEAWITPSQLYKGRLGPEQLVRIDLQGEVVGEAAGTPSSERLMHAAILRAREDVAAVVHSHAPQATLLALADVPFLPISTEAAFIGEIPRVPFILPGSRELAEEVVSALGPGPAVLLQNHGLVVAGETLRRAADMTKIIEQTATQILGCLAVGKEPPVIPAEVAEALRETGDLVG